MAVEKDIIAEITKALEGRRFDAGSLIIGATLVVIAAVLIRMATRAPGGVPVLTDVVRPRPTAVPSPSPATTTPERHAS